MRIDQNVEPRERVSGAGLKENRALNGATCAPSECKIQAPSAHQVPAASEGMAATAEVIDFSDARLRRDVKLVHRLGPRALYEMLLEVSEDRSLGTYIEELVGKYAAIDPAVLDAIGGRF